MRYPLPSKCVLLAVALLLVPAARAADKLEGGLVATITDAHDFKMKVGSLAFIVKPGEKGAAPLSLDHIPLCLENGKQANLWLAQIEKAEFSPKAKGRIEVRAVLQGEGDVVTGSIENGSKCELAGVIEEGERKGRAVRFPMAEVKSLEVHTRYEGGGPGALPGNIIPMPGPSEDVLWVSSVPLGAEVYAKPLGGRAAAAWKDYKRLGTTPFISKLPAGEYEVVVSVPSALAAKLRPSTKLGEDTNPFEPDGWGKLNFRKSENVVESMTYKIVKTAGKPATLIALFQSRGLAFDKVLEGFPPGRNFNFIDKKLEGVLLNKKVPRQEIPPILDALHRGGKVVWHGAEKSLMIELKPGERGWQITQAARPRKTK